MEAKLQVKTEKTGFSGFFMESFKVSPAKFEEKLLKEFLMLLKYEKLSSGHKCKSCRGFLCLFPNSDLRNCLMSFLELFIEEIL